MFHFLKLKQLPSCKAAKILSLLQLFSHVQKIFLLNVYFWKQKKVQGIITGDMADVQ
jgi:uncharacterized membrane protein YwaF